MARNLLQITQDYWRVSWALRSPDGDGLTLTTGRALLILNSSDRLRPEDWRLKDLMHVIRYDIIEGSTEWRDEQQATNSPSTPPTTL